MKQYYYIDVLRKTPLNTILEALRDLFNWTLDDDTLSKKELLDNLTDNEEDELRTYLFG